MLWAQLLGLVLGHGAIVNPRSRNSIDYLVSINTQRCANLTGGPCENGQASFWYSQGCYIGCESCDHISGRRQTDLCGSGMKATINNPLLRTVNRNATAGTDLDIYKHNPWRAPGYAPVADPCGLAGGTPWGPNVPEAGDYTNTTYAHHGMRGTDLPRMPTGVVWNRGEKVNVTWQIRNNHGGGYSYRLCPANETLTEKCFQQNPLAFDTKGQAILYPDGTLFPVDGTFISNGTWPLGSMWAMMPMPPTWLGPRCLPGPNDTKNTPYACEAWENINIDGPCKPCPQTPGSDCSRCSNGPNPAWTPPCKDCEGIDWEGHAVKDMVYVPKDISPGEYVLGFRYDCEATAQVWQNCADVTIV